MKSEGGVVRVRENKEGRERFVEIDGCILYAHIVGEKGNHPTVIMDAGYGDYSKAWKKIIPELSELTEVVMYDRAGLGGSESSSNERTSEKMMIELKEMLVKLNVKPPYVLVGHSFGGVNMRLFATEYEDEVAGLILIDSTHEDYRERFLPTMSLEFRDAYQKQFIHEGSYDEFMESLKQMKQKRRKLTIPLVVLCAGNKAHYSADSQLLWNEMQRELLALSEDSTFTLATNSAHYIQHDEPEVVIHAIKKMVRSF
ncbi:alpha/beta fold hydrolase [Priestia koreensis]|uniref:alpha/beta fold hydrolase n=1 Tax=Priestia koreensis TaxID=284581 RepID=UPI00345B3B2D